MQIIKDKHQAKHQKNIVSKKLRIPWLIGYLTLLKYRAKALFWGFLDSTL
jgi:hypothetical protein